MSELKSPARRSAPIQNGNSDTAPIVVYSAPWCPDCRRLKFFLSERQVEFREINIEEDPEAEHLVIRANHGKRRIPTLKVGDRYFSCSPFDALQLAEELQIPLNKQS
jgi:mycoredoxin